MYMLIYISLPLALSLSIYIYIYTYMIINSFAHGAYDACTLPSELGFVGPEP